MGFIKPLIALMVVVIISLGAWKMMGGPSEVLAGWTHSLDEGFVEASATSKPVFVYYTADWCPPCKLLKKHTFSHPEVSDFLHEKFVLVKIDLTEPNGPNSALAQANGVQSIPAMFIYDSEGLEISQKVGFMDEVAFMDWVSRSLTHIP